MRYYEIRWDMKWYDKIGQHKMKFIEKTRNIKRYEQVLWKKLDMMRFEEVWGNIIRYDRIWWNMMRYEEVLWDLVRYDEIW